MMGTATCPRPAVLRPHWRSSSDLLRGTSPAVVKGMVLSSRGAPVTCDPSAWHLTRVRVGPQRAERITTKMEMYTCRWKQYKLRTVQTFCVCSWFPARSRRKYETRCKRVGGVWLTGVCKARGQPHGVQGCIHGSRCICNVSPECYRLASERRVVGSDGYEIYGGVATRVCIGTQ